MADEFAKFADIFPIERAESVATLITLEEFAQAELAVEEALRGNFTLLAERQRTARVLLPIERVVTAAILKGELRKPNHRPTDPGTSAKNWRLAFAVAELMRDGETEKSATSKVAETAKKSLSTVRKAAKAYSRLFDGLVEISRGT